MHDNGIDEEYDEFDGLNWSEAWIAKIAFVDDKMKFDMLDFINMTQHEIRHERVHIVLHNFTALHLSINPFRQKKYQGDIQVVSFGEPVDETRFRLFQAATRENPFELEPAEYFSWNCWFLTDKIEITRTGEFGFRKVHRPDQ